MTDPLYIAGLKRYQEAMLKTAQRDMLPLTDAEMRHTSRKITTLLFGAAPSDKLPLKTLGRDALVFGKLFFGFVEISDAFDLLQDAQIYIKRFPHKGLIPPQRFMRYHITNYYNGVYVLNERLKTYATTVERTHKRSARVGSMSKAIEKLKEVVTTAMKPITVPRGHFIHQNHFEDDHFARLTATGLFATLGQKGDDNQLHEIMERLHKVSFKKARQEWTEKFIQYNMNISQLLDIYFYTLYHFVFDEDGNFIYPHSEQDKQC